MIKLMKLELRRNNIRGFVFASAVISALILAFLYFAAYVPQADPSPQNEQFMHYANIFRLVGTVSLVAFSTMSAVMYSRLITSEYSGKRAALLFSYPVSRTRILLSKLLLVFLFSSVSMLICTGLPFVIFCLTESVSPLVVQDTMTPALALETLRTMAVSVVTVAGIGIASMRIGFAKRSVPITMTSALVISALYGNAAINVSSPVVTLLISLAGLAVTVAIMAEMARKVEHMEAA